MMKFDFLDRIFVWHNELDEYWQWALSALLVLLPLDLFMTMYAASTVGLEHEANDIMIWLLTQEFGVVIGVHIAVITIVVGLLDLQFRIAMKSKYRDLILISGKAYLCLLTIAGLIVFTNNLSIILFHDGVLSLR